MSPLRLLLSQVMWGLTPGGPYPYNATGYARGYIQVGGLNSAPFFLHDGGRLNVLSLRGGQSLC